MVTHGHEPPLLADEMIGVPPASRVTVAHLGPHRQEWLDRAHAQGTMVFADAGWDEADRSSDAILKQLPMCHAFLPNAAEAMAYTRTDSPERALSKLGDLVPVAVITRGGEGVIAADATTGESASVPGLVAEVLDATGAATSSVRDSSPPPSRAGPSSTACASPTSVPRSPSSSSAAPSPHQVGRA